MKDVPASLQPSRHMRWHFHPAHGICALLPGPACISTKNIDMIQKIAAVLLFLSLAACSESSSTDKISLDQARAEHESGKVVLIDIRERNEHLSGVAPGAVLLPMSELAQKPALIPSDSAKPVLLICNTQNRSKATLDQLKQLGYHNVRYVEGGMSQWTAKGWPLVAPR